MKKTLFLALILPACGLAQDGQPGGDWDARITAVQGEATLYPEGGQNGIPAEMDMPLNTGDRIKTGPDGRVELALDGQSVMDIGPSSEFTLSSLQRRDSSFALDFGSLVAKIKKLVGGGRLGVATPTAVAAIRGTEFGVDVSQEGDKVGVFKEGHVEVSSRENPSIRTFLNPNHETQWRKGETNFSVRPLTYFRSQQKRIQYLRARLPALRRQWTPRSPDQRRDLRQRMLQRPPGMQEGQPQGQQPPRPRRMLRPGGPQEENNRRRGPKGH